jgi:hypothetical protein
MGPLGERRPDNHGQWSVWRTGRSAAQKLRLSRDASKGSGRIDPHRFFRHVCRDDARGGNCDHGPARGVPRRGVVDESGCLGDGSTSCVPPNFSVMWPNAGRRLWAPRWCASPRGSRWWTPRGPGRPCEARWTDRSCSRSRRDGPQGVPVPALLAATEQRRRGRAAGCRQGLKHDSDEGCAKRFGSLASGFNGRIPGCGD